MEFNGFKESERKVTLASYMVPKDLAEKVLAICPPRSDPRHERGKYGHFMELAVRDLLEKLGKEATKKERAEEAVKKRVSENRSKPIVSDAFALTPQCDGIETPASDDYHAQGIFDHWKMVMNKNDSSIFNAKRKKAVKARLKEGYLPETIKIAIDGCAKTAHNMGGTDGKIYNDLELICRDGANVERFAGNDTQAVAPRQQRVRPDRSALFGKHTGANVIEGEVL